MALIAKYGSICSCLKPWLTLNMTVMTLNKEKLRAGNFLKSSFEQLIRGRERQNGILGEGEELSAPDSLTKAAESALKNEQPEIAKVAVHEFSSKILRRTSSIAAHCL